MARQLELRQNLALALHEQRDHAIFERTQLEDLAIERDAPRRFVEGEAPGGAHGLLARTGAPKQRAQPCHQFLGAKRLRQVIVGAGVETIDPLHPGAARRQHQHRCFQPRPAPALEDRQTIHAGQAQIENDRGVGAVFTLLPHVRTVGQRVDAIAFRFQLHHHMGGDVAIVLRQKNAHSVLRIQTCS
ncbi:hypothetical protein D9M72_562450 [compost metagenome]